MQRSPTALLLHYSNAITNDKTTLDFIDSTIKVSLSQLTISQLCKIRRKYTKDYGAVNTGNKVNTVQKYDDLFNRR